ncbi:MAG: hypothetical protein AB1Z51_10845 [Desulfuromonadales bacterium]
MTEQDISNIEPQQAIATSNRIIVSLQNQQTKSVLRQQMEKAWLSMLNHVSLQIHLYDKAKIGPNPVRKPQIKTHSAL